MVSEDIATLDFYYIDNALVDKPVVKCIDAYYPELNITFPSQ